MERRKEGRTKDLFFDGEPAHCYCVFRDHSSDLTRSISDVSSLGRECEGSRRGGNERGPDPEVGRTGVEDDVEWLWSAETRESTSWSPQLTLTVSRWRVSHSTTNLDPGQTQ